MVVAKENAYRLKSWVSGHGYDISFPMFNNTSNAGLPSLRKTKFWQREELNEKTGNKRSKQYFIWIALLIIELQKPVVGNHFIEFFFSSTICSISNDKQMIHLRIVCFRFHMGRSRAKIQPVIASDSSGEFCQQPALNDNPELLVHIEQYFSPWALLFMLQILQ